MRTDRRRTATATDRRASPRAPLVAAVLKLDGGGGEAELAQTVNIGAAGLTLLRVCDGAAHAPATPLHLSFQLPGDEQPIDLDAEVIFDRPCDGGRLRATGVRFAVVDDTNARRIAAYLDRQVAV